MAQQATAAPHLDARVLHTAHTVGEGIKRAQQIGALAWAESLAHHLCQPDL